MESLKVRLRMSVPEEEILHPSDPLSNPDDWASFGLRKVKVVSQETGELVSLLTASTQRKLTMLGQLDEVAEVYQNQLRTKEHQRRTIEVKDIRTYAFAEYEDGTYGFWAAGKAGWFEIETPAASYKAIHKQMNEATSLLYTLADKLRRAQKAKPKLIQKELDKYVKRVCADYQAQTKDLTKYADADDVREALHEHRIFLITSMLEGQEGLDWIDTPMFNYFKQKFPNELRQINSTLPVFQQGTTSTINATGPIVFPGLIQKMAPERERKSTSPAPVAETTEPQRKRKSTSPPPVVETKPQKRRGRPPKSSMTENPRTSSSVMKENLTTSDEDELSTSPIHKRKSILQPVGSKSAKKAKKGPGRKRTRSGYQDDKSSDDDAVDEDDLAYQAAIAPIQTIRNGNHLEEITNPRQQHAGSSSAVRRPQQPIYLPRKYLEIRAVTYPIPSLEPQGPGDLWTCSLGNCHKRVHLASTPEGKELVREHLKSHIKDNGAGNVEGAQHKIDLALDESRPYLPVGNLVRRLQHFVTSPNAEPAEDSIERKFQRPIQRRY